MFRLSSFRQDIRWWRREGEPLTELSPPYQRKGKQWTSRQKAYLIDSILNGYDLPKLYFADFSFARSPLSGSGHQYAIIDGKQRLEAIGDFVRGDLALELDFALLEDPDATLGGKSFHDLAMMRPDLVARFDDFVLDIVMVATDDEARINDMFVRLNSGTGLTGAQVRNAMEGRWPQVIRDVAGHEFFVRKIGFPTRQSQDLNVAAKLLMLEFRGALQDTKRRHLDLFVRDNAALESELRQAHAGAGDLTRTARRVDRVLDRGARIFFDRDTLLRTQGPITVYYWLIRHLDQSADRYLRDFLIDFERRRLHNRKLAREFGVRGRRVNPEFVAFDSYRRNANDARSIEAMFYILYEQFKTHVEGM